MNRGTLRTQTADFCGDKNQTRYSATQYNAALDRSQEQFAMDTRALWKDCSWTTVSGTSSYTLASATSTAADFMWEDWVMYDGIEITPISRHELQRLSGTDWTTVTGTPTHYILDPEEGKKQITLYPQPNAAKTLAMRYYPLPTAMTADSDTPLNASLLMAQFHIGLAAYAATLLLMSEEVTAANSAKRAELLNIYLNAASKAVDTFKNTASAPLKIKGSRLWR